MRRILGTLAFLLIAGLAPAADSDNFRLTMPGIRSTMTAMKELVLLLDSDPQLRARFEAEKDKLENTNGRDANSMTAARLESKEPRIAAVYRKAGISPVQAGMTLETLLGVVMGDAMLEASKTKADLPGGFVAENMVFYRQNKAEIMQVLGELRALGSSRKDKHGESDGDDEQ